MAKVLIKTKLMKRSSRDIERDIFLHFQVFTLLSHLLSAGVVGDRETTYRVNGSLNKLQVISLTHRAITYELRKGFTRVILFFLVSFFVFVIFERRSNHFSCRIISSPPSLVRRQCEERGCVAA